MYSVYVGTYSANSVAFVGMVLESTVMIVSLWRAPWHSRTISMMLNPRDLPMPVESQQNEIQIPWGWVIRAIWFLHWYQYSARPAVPGCLGV